MCAASPALELLHQAQGDWILQLLMEDSGALLDNDDWGLERLQLGPMLPVSLCMHRPPPR